MKNMKIDGVQSVHLDNIEGCDEFAINSITGEICVASPISLAVVDSGVITRLVNWETERRGQQIVSLAYRTDANQIAAILADGRALIVTEEDEVIELEICQIPENSHTAAEWSGDEQLLAICDDSNIYLSDSTLLCFEQRSLEFSESERASAPVNVGWGSEMTQFRGSEGKIKAGEKLEKERESIEQHCCESQVHWRWDGEYVAVSYFSKPRDTRFLTVFDKNGDVMSTMNIRNIYLSNCFAHKPNANLICSAVLNGNSSSDGLIFYERNGETRNGYKIKWKEHDGDNDSSKRIIQNLAWNSTGSILAIQTKTNNILNLEFWRLSNYEFTRKYTWRLPSADLKWRWSVVEESRMYVLLSDSRIISLDVSSSVSYSPDLQLNLVVASDEIRVSNLCRRVIPPPMCESTIRVESGIVAYTTSPGAVHILDENWKISKYSCAGNGTKFEKMEASFDLSGQFSIVSAFLFNPATDSYIIWGLEANNDENVVDQIGKDGQKQSLFRGSNVTWIGLNPGTGNVEIALSNGSFMNCSSSQRIFEIPSFSSISSIFFTPSGERVFLTDDSSLYIDSTRVTNSVVSFLPRGNDILLIDFDNKLRFVDLEKRAKNEEDTRDVEAGCEIVAVSPDSVNVVLQATRGNLETIQPRKFVMTETRRMLNAKQYIPALLWMKKHRIDMSYCMQFLKEKLAEDANIWLESNDSSLLEQLVVSCTERNDLGELPHLLCKTVYESIKKIVDVERKTRVFPLMLTSLLRMSPPRVDQALKEIQEHVTKIGDRKDVFTRQSLHHISFFVAAKQLFNCALSTYDLKLAQQVAEASNYDPKEYLPVLNRLNRFGDQLEREFRINVTREAWCDAVEKLFELDARDGSAAAAAANEEWWREAKEIIERESLHRDALRVLKPADKRYGDCCELYAAELERKAHWKHAAMFFELAGNWEKTSKCYEMAKDVDGLMAAARKFGVERAKLKIHAIKMMGPLKEARMLRELAKAMRLADSPNIRVVETLCDAQEWEHARREAIAEEETQMVRKMGIARNEQICEEIQRRLGDFEKYRTRLSIVRENKLKRVEQFAAGEVEDLRDDISQVSSISSRSGSSRVSMASSVRKRKQIEKKKGSLKEGGEYEDSALFNAIAEIYRWLETTRGELVQLVPVLMSVGEVGEALDTKKMADEMAETLKKARGSIWPDSLAIQHLPGPLYALFDPSIEPSPIAMPSVFRLEPELISPSINYSDICP